MIMMGREARTTARLHANKVTNCRSVAAVNIATYELHGGYGRMEHDVRER